MTVSPLRDQKGQPIGCVNVITDITHIKQAEAALALNAARLQVLLDLHLLARAPLEEILDFVQEAAPTAMQSEYCWLGLMDETESVVTVRRWSKQVMAQCAVTDKPMRFPVAEAGLWGDCVRQRQAVLVNDYQAPHPSKKGCRRGMCPSGGFSRFPYLMGPASSP